MDGGLEHRVCVCVCVCVCVSVCVCVCQRTWKAEASRFDHTKYSFFRRNMQQEHLHVQLGRLHPAVSPSLYLMCCICVKGAGMRRERGACT